MEGKGGVGGQSSVSFQTEHLSASDVGTVKSVQTTKWGMISVVRDVKPLIPKGLKRYTPKALLDRVMIRLGGEDKFVAKLLSKHASKSDYGQISSLLQQRAPTVESLDRLAAKLTPKQLADPVIQKAVHNHYIGVKVDSSTLANVSLDPNKSDTLEGQVETLVHVAWDGTGQPNGTSEKKWREAIQDDELNYPGLSKVLVSASDRIAQNAQEGLLQARIRYEEARLLRDKLLDLKSDNEAIKTNIRKLGVVMQFTNLEIKRNDTEVFKLTKTSYLTPEDNEFLRKKTPQRQKDDPKLPIAPIVDPQTVKELSIASKATQRQPNPKQAEKPETGKDQVKEPFEKLALAKESETSAAEIKRSKPGLWASQHTKAAYKLMDDKLVTDSEMSIIETMYGDLKTKGITSKQFAKMLGEFPRFADQGADIYEFLGGCVFAAKHLQASPGMLINEALDDGMEDIGFDN